MGEQIIDVKGLYKHFGSFTALRNVDFSVDKGQKVVICGPSGSGKSTLIRCLNGLELADRGQIMVDGLGVDDNPATLTQLRCRMGMVFQQFNLFPHLSVLDNVMLAPVKVLGRGPKEVEAKAKQLLASVQIEDQAEKYPAQLSGGQQQRVAIARALCMEPKILLFDEPTSALDPEMIKEVLDVMVALAQGGVTMICVTHEMGFARQVADRVVFMEDGEVVEDSEAEVFFEQPRSERTRRFLGQILAH